MGRGTATAKTARRSAIVLVPRQVGPVIDVPGWVEDFILVLRAKAPVSTLQRYIDAVQDPAKVTLLAREMDALANVTRMDEERLGVMKRGAGGHWRRAYRFVWGVEQNRADSGTRFAAARMFRQTPTLAGERAELRCAWEHSTLRLPDDMRGIGPDLTPVLWTPNAPDALFHPPTGYAFFRHLDKTAALVWYSTSNRSSYQLRLVEGRVACTCAAGTKRLACWHAALAGAAREAGMDLFSGEVSPTYDRMITALLGKAGADRAN